MFFKIKVLCALYFLNGISCLKEGDECRSIGVKGKCRALSTCESTSLYDKKHGIVPEYCSREGYEPIVCCTDCHPVLNISQAVVIKTNGIYYKTNGKNKAWDKCLEYLEELPYSCKDEGFGFVSKMYNARRECHYLEIVLSIPVVGVDARRKEFPHMALLGYGEDQVAAQWLCGGTIISEWYILTAGHCRSAPLVGNVSYVALGILKRSDPPSLWQVYRVDTFIPHPEYRPPSKYHDIALIRTDKRIKFERNVLPICLQSFEDYEDNNNEGVVVGWGAIGHRKPVADVLQKAIVEKFTDTECGLFYPQHRNLKVGVNSTSQACYGHHVRNYDTCEGDSGGPLQRRYAYKGLYCATFQFGVTSYGRPCGFNYTAGIYTLIRPYLPWIETVVWP